MNKTLLLSVLAIIIITSLGFYYAGTLNATGQVTMKTESESTENLVTVDNFIRAETDNYFRLNVLSRDSLGKITHDRNLVQIDQQDIIRSNQDTLYSYAILDLTNPVTITKPETGGRFQSMLIINQDHYTKMIEEDAGTFILNQDNMGTRYVMVLFRTLVDVNNPADVSEANKVQDGLSMEQSSPGTLDLPDWDQKSLAEVRETLNKIALTQSSSAGAFGDEDEVDPLIHLLGTASGWAGSPDAATVYVNGNPKENYGNIPYTLTIEGEVPVDGFWSITMYNKEGFLEKNEYNSNIINDRNAVTNEDGNIVIHFGGDPTNTNFLPITEGWAYVVRMYQPREEILNGSWTFPDIIKVA